MRHLSVNAAIVAIVVAQLFAQEVLAFGTEEKGNKPLNKLNYTEWQGIMPIVNDKARVYQVWVNGNESLYYEGTTTQLNAALSSFAKIDVKNHVVVLCPGPVEQHSFHDKTPISYNWELHVIGGLAKSRATDDLEDLEWQKDPVMTVYIGGDIDLDKIEIPKHVTLRTAPGKSQEARMDDAARKRIETFVEQQKHPSEQ